MLATLHSRATAARMFASLPHSSSASATLCGSSALTSESPLLAHFVASLAIGITRGTLLGLWLGRRHLGFLRCRRRSCSCYEQPQNPEKKGSFHGWLGYVSVSPITEHFARQLCQSCRDLPSFWSPALRPSAGRTPTRRTRRSVELRTGLSAIPGICR